VELILCRKTSTALSTARIIAGTFTSAARPNCHPTKGISATAAALTPSRNAPASGDLRSFGKNADVTPT
jgi:hypothetical protein